MEKNKKKIKNKEILVIIIAVLAGALLFLGIWKYYNSTYNCIGCRNTPCSSAFDCDCGDNEKTCKCLYNDIGEVTKKIECPNNSFKTTNSNR